MPCCQGSLNLLRRCVGRDLDGFRQLVHLSSEESRNKNPAAAWRKARHGYSLYGGFLKWGVPKIDGFLEEKLIRMDDLGVPLFLETTICI